MSFLEGFAGRISLRVLKHSPKEYRASRKGGGGGASVCVGFLKASLDWTLI